MFDQTFVDGAGKTNKSWAVTLSFVLEFAAIGVLILVPLIWVEVLPKAQSVNALTAPAPPPPPLPPASAPVMRQPRIARRFFSSQALEAPHTTLRQVAMPPEDAMLPPAVGVGELSAPGAGLSASTAVFSGGIRSSSPLPSSAASNAGVKPRQEAPLPVGGDVQRAKLIKHPSPTYPAIAKSARIQGTVVLQALIGKDGTVRNLKVVSAASPLLVASAVDAVKQWVYRPTLLNQEPVEVISEITVIFALQ